ncbi:MAG TPA: hypothetical protein VL069_08345 [Opitutus sp.]|nr:hypothetical protein [Opitutus sp.]
MNSFLQGKKILSVAPLRPMSTAAPVPPPQAGTKAPTLSSACAGGTQPTVEVIKEGDKVVRLVVVCSCGERVEIECLYPGAG